MNAFKEAAKRKNAVRTKPKGEVKEGEGAGAINEAPDPVVWEQKEEEDMETNKKGGEIGEIDTLLGGIVKKQKPVKKSSTLYLSQQNLEQLKKRAKKAGTSSSDYLDMLLSKLFGATNK